LNKKAIPSAIDSEANSILTAKGRRPDEGRRPFLMKRRGERSGSSATLTCIKAPIARWDHLKFLKMKEANMRLSIALSALLITGFVAVSPEKASAVVYCQYISYPVGCVARPGVVLVARPVVGVAGVGVGAPGVGVRAGTPMNRGGPVNRVGRR
jgi:hypothetical protein